MVVVVEEIRVVEIFLAETVVNLNIVTPILIAIGAKEGNYT